jgi:GntR family transcriptional regulator
VREPRYRELAAELRRRIEEDVEFGAGRLLPSEAELSAAYGVSRVTVRRALEWLRSDGGGLVDSRQGYGWFVAGEPVRQSLGRLGTIEAQLSSRGVESERRILDFGFVRALPHVRAVLGASSVLQVRRLNLADGRPFARVTVWVPEELGAGLSRRDVEQSPFYDLLPVRLGSARQTIGASACSVEDAAVLDVPAGSPVLRCERVTRTVDDVPVLLSEWVFPGLATEFVIDLPEAPPVWRT